MTKVAQYTITGKTIEEFSLPEGLFAGKVNPSLMAQAVRVFLGNQRQATAHAKTRGEGHRTTKKVYKQKGTGNARHGDRNAPIYVGGGQAFGPTGTQNYRGQMSQKMRRASLISALTQMANEGQVAVITDLAKASNKSKDIAKLVAAIKEQAKAKKVTFVLAATHKDIVKSGGNVASLSLTQARHLNTYEVLNAGYLVFGVESIEALAALHHVEVKTVAAKPAVKTVKPAKKAPTVKKGAVSKAK